MDKNQHTHLTHVEMLRILIAEYVYGRIAARLGDPESYRRIGECSECRVQLNIIRRSMRSQPLGCNPPEGISPLRAAAVEALQFEIEQYQKEFPSS